MQEFFLNCESAGRTAHSQLKWPTSTEDLADCMDAMIPLIGPTLDLGPKSEYSQKYLLRKMLLVVGEDRFGAGALDYLSVDRILAWVPDAHKNMAPLKGKTGREVRRLFSCGAPMVSCWACMAQRGSTTNTMFKTLAMATPSQLLRLAAREDVSELTEPEGCRPGLPWLCEQVLAGRHG